MTKLSTNGTHVWSRIIDGGDHRDNFRGQKIVCDSNDNLYFSGDYTSTFRCVIKKEDGTQLLSGSFAGNGQGTGCFICKFDSNGAHRWSRTFHTYNPLPSTFWTFDSFYCDLNTNNIYVSGKYGGMSFIQKENATDILRTTSIELSAKSYIYKLDTNGDYKWSRILNPGDLRLIASDNTNMYLISRYVNGTQIRTETSMTIGQLNLPDPNTIIDCLKFSDIQL
jgi:hypothetical protein